MKARLAELVAALRHGGVPVSVAEAIDAAAALAVVGVERAVLRDALAATLVKREQDRAIYDDAFDRLFPARVAAASRAQRRRLPPPAGGGEGEAFGGGGGGSTGASGQRDDAESTSGSRTRSSHPSRPRKITEATDATRGRDGDAETPPSRRRAADRAAAERAAGARADKAATQRRSASGSALDDEDGDSRGTRAGAERMAGRARERALLTMPFRAMSAREIDEAAALVRALARRFRGRLSRRLRRRSRGRLDFRRTIRSSIAHGGVPVERRFRARRPRKLALVALCDLSASTATATDFFLALLAPATDYFTRVRLYGFVDRLVEIEFVAGQVRPAAPIDLMARSDFGRVLRDLAAGPADELTADTLVLVLGDARNNRRPPRADLLAAVRRRVRRLVWLDPEPVERWNTGDSVIAAYARHADDVVACGSLAELDRAIAAICRA